MSPSSNRPLAIVALALALAAAGSTTAEAAVPEHDTGVPGREAYLRHCARCHQRDGRGIEGLYPTLRGLDPSEKARTRSIRGLLRGRIGEITVDGTRYDNVMPSHGYLGNETIAGTLSYVLSAWSAVGAPVTTEEVAAARLALLKAHPAPSDPVTGVSPLADMDAVQYVTSAGPPMSVDEFERARRLYYGRCTGCHGVLREGIAGTPLTPELMRQRGTEYLQSVISYGSVTGMPNWGTSNELSGVDISLLARFLQHPVPQPPDMDQFQIRDSWNQLRIPSERPSRPQHDYDIDRMFVVALHDVGEIALLDGIGKSVIARVPVGRAPQRVVASASGRYLYVMCRDGTLSLVDLYASPPERVASVRIGYEARAVAASRSTRDPGYVLAGAYWPPQLVLLDGRTLEPLRVLSTRGYSAQDHRYHPEPRVSDIAASPARSEFIAQIKETGHVYLFPYGGDGGLLEVRDLDTVPELRAGSFSADGRYYLTPADRNAVSVLDVDARRIVAEIPARVFGGNPGVAYVDPQLGPVWATTTMVTNDLIVIGTDPADHPEGAWHVVQRVAGPATGSLFLATHPRSHHLWTDTPLSADPAFSQSVAVYRKGELARGFRTLPVAAWSGLEHGPRRVIQPAFSMDGTEVWMVVWNPQDADSAVVVVDDATLEPVATIREPELITPTRLYSVAALRHAGVIAESAAEAPDLRPQPADGAALYASHCANCHGVYGEGDGPMAPALAMQPRDLRYLAGSGGDFPAEFVRQIIDGRTSREAHGPEGMPVWGSVLARDGNAEERINALVHYVAAMQIADD